MLRVGSMTCWTDELKHEDGALLKWKKETSELGIVKTKSWQVEW